MKLIKVHFCLLLLLWGSFADDSVLRHGPPPPEVEDEDLASESNITQHDPAPDQEGHCVVSLDSYLVAFFFLWTDIGTGYGGARMDSDAHPWQPWRQRLQLWQKMSPHWVLQVRRWVGGILGKKNIKRSINWYQSGWCGATFPRGSWKAGRRWGNTKVSGVYYSYISIANNFQVLIKFYTQLFTHFFWPSSVEPRICYTSWGLGP